MPRTGLEPAHLAACAPETHASTNSAIWACEPNQGSFRKEKQELGPALFHSGAENETRTRDPDLGKVVLYQLSYFRIFERSLSASFSKAGAKVLLFFDMTKFLCKKNQKKCIFLFFSAQFAPLSLLQRGKNGLLLQNRVKNI